jgi:hypothetical protein
MTDFFCAGESNPSRLNVQHCAGFTLVRNLPWPLFFKEGKYSPLAKFKMLRIRCGSLRAAKDKERNQRQRNILAARLADKESY